MRKKVISIVLALCMLTGMASACSKEKEAEISAPEKLEWREKNCAIAKTIYAQKFAECMCTSYAGVTYCFEKKTFQKKGATKFIKAAMELVAYADEVFEVKNHEKQILLNVSGAREELDVGNYAEFDTLWKVIEQVHKVYAGEQYGLFYLYCLKHGLIEESRVNEEEIRSYFAKNENLYLLDFCIPMLETKIFDEKQALMTREAIKSFAVWYEKKYSYGEYEKLCTGNEKTDKNKLVKAKNEWLGSLGVDASYEEFAKIEIAPSDKSFSYYVKNRDGRSRIEKFGDYEWNCGDVCWVWFADVVKKLGYSSMIKSVIKIEPLRKIDYAEAREFLKDYLPEKVEPVNIALNLGETRRGDIAGEYIAPDTIIMHSDWDNAYWSLLHEYCHHLTEGKNHIMPENNGIFNEWLAEWISVYELENREAQLVRFLSEKEYLESAKENTVMDVETRSIPELNYLLFLSLNNEKKADYKRFRYVEKATLSKYIYETYGIGKVAELVNTRGEFETVLGIDVETLYKNARKWVGKQLQ